MIKTLRESKAKLSELVEVAARGEEVIITVHGQPKARLSPVVAVPPRDRAAWVAELKALHRACGGRKRLAVGGVSILEELREERG